MGVHESQSLLWERMVALGRPFSRYLAPKLAAAFPQLSDKLSPDTLYGASLGSAAACKADAKVPMFVDLLARSSCRGAMTKSPSGASACGLPGTRLSLPDGCRPWAGAVNVVKTRSMIRVEADEVTYPLHIILRCARCCCCPLASSEARL